MAKSRKVATWNTGSLTIELIKGNGFYFLFCTEINVFSEVLETCPPFAAAAKREALEKVKIKLQDMLQSIPLI